MPTLVPMLLGALAGGLFVLLVARQRASRRRRLLAIGLAVAALIYLVLAGLGGDGRRLALETGGVVLFTGLAWFGATAAPIALAIGWAAHAAWDIGLHLGPVDAMVPRWYPPACVGFDLVAAGYAFGLSRAAARSRVDAR